jgi:hypothetical protein
MIKNKCSVSIITYLKRNKKKKKEEERKKNAGF